MSEETSLMNTLLSLFGIGTMATISRSILSEDRRTLAGFFRGLVLALFVGFIVGSLIQDYNFSPSTQGGIVGVCAFVADDLLLIVLSVTTKLRNNPRIIIDYITGRAGQDSSK